MQESTGERQLTDVFTQATPEQLDRVMADAADLANFIFSVSGDGKERLKLADAIRLLLVIQEEEFASGRGVTSPQGLGRGHLAPDGGPPLWGEAPCLSTYDLQRVGRFDTTAHTLLMVENAAPLAVLARDGWGHQGYLVAYLAGMPKLAFFDFLPKLRGPGLAASLLWVDWDVGGLRILRNLLGRWPSHLPPLRVVPHPA
ncbi:MAG TPA: DUF2399 domain-containing protein, partial [Firmicutes bacterium]|nr:DUF2399 domain-containing protein [Bacillota bacterium]